MRDSLHPRFALELVVFGDLLDSAGYVFGHLAIENSRINFRPFGQEQRRDAEVGHNQRRDLIDLRQFRSL